MKITATVSKKTNSAWAGRGTVIRLNLRYGSVSLHMTTGAMKGCVGAFLLDEVKFHVDEES